MHTPHKNWYLYLLECQDGSIYTGIALDLKARLEQHKSVKGARYTRSHLPLCLLAVAEFYDRSSAQRAEYKLKRCTSQQKRAIAEQLSQGESVHL